MLSVKSVTTIDNIVLSFLISLVSMLLIIPFMTTSPIGDSICSMAVTSSSKSLPYNISVLAGFL